MRGLRKKPAPPVSCQAPDGPPLAPDVLAAVIAKAPTLVALDYYRLDVCRSAPEYFHALSKAFAARRDELRAAAALAVRAPGGVTTLPHPQVGGAA